MNKQCEGQLCLQFDEKLNTDTATPISVFCLYHNLDIKNITLLNDNIDKSRITFVNNDKNIQFSLQSTGKILDRIDFLVVLLSENLLLDYALLNILMLNYEENAERVIMIISDDKLYNTECKLSIYTTWTKSIDQYKNAINNNVINDDVLNTFNALLNAKKHIPSHLKNHCIPITEYCSNILDKFCDSFEQRNIKNLRKRQSDTKITPIDKYKKLKTEGGSTMSHVTQNITIQEMNGPIVAPTGDNPTIDMRKNDLDFDKIESKLNSLIDSAKKDLEKLNKDDADKILFILEDILTAVEKKNKVRLGTYLSNLNSAISICTNGSKLFNSLNNILETAENFLP